MMWHLSHRFDPEAAAIADRHYNRRKPGSPQFVPPGRCLVLKTEQAVWVSSWPFAEYVRHDRWKFTLVCDCGFTATSYQSRQEARRLHGQHLDTLGDDQ